MVLTQSQKVSIEKAKASGSGELGGGLEDDVCNFLIATIAKDLRILKKFPEIPKKVPDFFKNSDPRGLTIPGLDFNLLIERLYKIEKDADTYFTCLATLHKSRIKYIKILETQSIPTMEQVGPRSLLQYGQMSPEALAGFLLWRKWIFDIDNRAGQETGYLFEPIIANAIGGAPFSAVKSPIKRHKNPSKGRQVDCIRKKMAYEIKIRVTIAASGQGRWQEELDFPIDCKKSGYKPVLIVLDSTRNPKLDNIISAFDEQGGESYVGADAWNHLEDAAGKVMSLYIEKYVKAPMKKVLKSTPNKLPDITFKIDEDTFNIIIEDENIDYKRGGN